jgi:hypothetical protein
MKITKILNEMNIKTHKWTSHGSEQSFKYQISRDVFTGKYTAWSMDKEFPHASGNGDTEESAVRSLQLRIMQLRNKKK